MPDVRYMGSAHWTQVVTKDDGKFDKTVNVAPGEVVSLTDAQANKLADPSVPRANRVFVMAGSSEDPESKDYEYSKYDRVTGNASADPALDFGSTVQSERTITRTEDDNEEGYVVAGADEGPQTDNTRLYEADEVQRAADKAAADAKAKQSTAKRPASASNTPAEKH